MWIAYWAWDDRNLRHLARHGVSANDVRAVWRGDPRFRRNRKGRTATHQMVGPDRSGRLLTVFILETAPGTWRAITARPSTRPEEDWWRKS